jgi:hypothetical protein
MQKYAEHALTSVYAKIRSIQFWYLINQVMICGHSMLHVYDVENTNMHFMQNPVFTYNLRSKLMVFYHWLIYKIKKNII